jgi:hypothetical protein
MSDQLTKLLEKIEKLNINEKDKKEIEKIIGNIKKSVENKDKKNKKIKDPNEPKRPKNAFMLFMDDVRKIKNDKKPGVHFPSNWIDDIKDVVNNSKNKPVTELSKACGTFWKDAKSDEKIKYENIYKKHQDKYKKEMEKYKKENKN